jgi:glutamate 5-kinase
LRPTGSITIDAGAVQALRSGRSLLPAGVTAVQGRFARGDTVSVLDPDGVEIARGMAAYNDEEAARIRGKRSADIEALVGFRGRAEMIHRDNLVIMRADAGTTA